MSDIFQSGRHPDADQLSAFAEQALAAHEREATLAHLAVCAECRAVVALLPSAEPIPKPAEKPARRIWFHGWHLAWPAAAAVAALALVLAFVHNARVTRSGSGHREEMAIAPPPVPITPRPVPQKQVSGPLPPKVHPRPSSAARQAMQRDAANLKAFNRAPTPARSAPGMQAAAGEGGAGNVSQKNSLQQAPAIAYGRAPQTPAAEAKAQNKALAPAATMNNELAANPRKDQLQAVIGEAGSGSRANETSNKPAFQSISTVHPLPSGLPVLSVARHEPQMLAIDSAHSLFLSDDAGAHWRAVAVPWKARAVAVSLISSPTRIPSNTENGLDKMVAPVAGASVKKLPNAEGAASITGKVTDPTGAAIPGASVAVSRATDHVSQSVTTDRNGRYRVAGLAPGRYDVEARAPGFETAHLSAVDVPTAAQTVANLKLMVGTASETVTVAGPAAEEIPLEKQGEAAVPAAAAAPPEANAAPRIFEITTDDGSRWISPDGVTWNRE